MLIVDLAWTDNNDDESSYRVEHRFVQGAGFTPWTEIASVPAGTQDYTHNEGNAVQPPALGQNEWRIRAERDGQFGPYSAAIQLTLVNPPLNAPINLTAAQVL